MTTDIVGKFTFLRRITVQVWIIQDNHRIVAVTESKNSSRLIREIHYPESKEWTIDEFHMASDQAIMSEAIFKMQDKRMPDS